MGSLSRDSITAAPYTLTPQFPYLYLDNRSLQTQRGLKQTHSLSVFLSPSHTRTHTHVPTVLKATSFKKKKSTQFVLVPV